MKPRYYRKMLASLLFYMTITFLFCASLTIHGISVEITASTFIIFIMLNISAYTDGTRVNNEI